MQKIKKLLFSTKSIPSFYTDTTSYLIENGNAVWSDRNYIKFSQEGYLKNVIVHRAVTLIANACSSIKIVLKENSKVANNHQLNPILAEPCPSTSFSQFIENVVSYKLISGNAFLLANKDSNGLIKEIYTLRPDRVKVIEGQKGLPQGYKYSVNEKENYFAFNPISFTCDILHIKSFNPLSNWYGVSPIEAAAFAVDQHNQASNWNQSLLQNSARPSGALIFKNDTSLTEKQYTRLQEEIKRKYQSVQNTGRPMILEGGVDWKEMSLSPKDMDFIESKNLSAREIALAFGVPPQMLGIAGDNTYANLQEARLSLWEQTVIPLMENVVSSLNNWLKKFAGNENIEISFDKDGIDAMAEKRYKLWERLENSTFLTVSEKRKILGFEEGF
jgi:HK97 family phage portal protein